MIDFANKNVLVMGLGLNQGGLGVAKYTQEQGANVIVTDLKTKEELKETIVTIESDENLSKLELVLGEHREEDIEWADYVIKNPAVPVESHYVQYAFEKKKRVLTEFEIFFDALHDKPNVKTIGVTGTRGKSTTTALIAHLLKSIQDTPVYLVGNIRKSALEILTDLPDEAYVCMELSSFQLELLKKSPDIAVFTSFFPDHLNRHHTMQEYLVAKSHIFLYQRAGGKLIVNDDNHHLHHHLSVPMTTEKLRVSMKSTDTEYYFDKGNLKNKDQSLMSVEDVLLPGKHNQMNFALAVAAINEVLQKIDYKSLKESLHAFPGLPGRQEKVAVINDVTYINDTTSTMPEALITALAAFADKNIVLISGGNDKGLDYSNISKITGKISFRKVLITPGTAQEKLQEQFQPEVDIELAQSTDEAFQKATEYAEAGDIVLFSPAATSFGEFRHEFERGDAFTQYVSTIS